MFRNRRDAGRQLARLLLPYANRSDVLVLALPRGGVPVAAEVAAALAAPFDVFLVRKLGVPFHPELAMGAVAEGGVRVLNRQVIDTLQIPESDVERVSAGERLELDRPRALPLALLVAVVGDAGAGADAGAREDGKAGMRLNEFA